MNFCVQHVIANILEKQIKNFGTQLQKHNGSDKKLPIYNHLLECEHFNYVVNFHC